MSHTNPLVLQVHLAGAEPYELGDEIWQQSLPDAIRVEAETIADYADRDLLPLPGQAGRVAVRDGIVAEMTAALWHAGDTYTAPDGIAYTLTNQAQLDLPIREDTLAPLSSAKTAPVVEEVLRFEDLPVGSSATRCAVVRWSDGTESQALAWYGDEILICEGDLIGKTQPSFGPCTSAEIATGCSPDSATATESASYGRVHEIALSGGCRSGVRGAVDPHLPQIPVGVNSRVDQREDLTGPIDPARAGKHRNAPAVDIADAMPLTIATLTDVQ
jgi:hypothetical protein